MLKISATVITFNEEHNIRRCLESIRWVDEIVVIDSHSTDRTIEICKEFTDKVIQRDWPGHIDQKNYAVDSATHDWILSLDADEEVSPELLQELKAIAQNGPTVDGYAMPRKVHYLNRWIRYGGWYPDHKVRLFNRQKARWGGINPHDRIIMDSKPIYLTGDLYHYSFRDVSAHIRQINSFTSIGAEELMARDIKPSWFRLMLHPLAKFFKSYILKAGFLEGRAGFYIAISGSFYVYLKYVKHWELWMNKYSSQNISDGK